MSDLTDATLFKALDGLRPVHGGDGRYLEGAELPPVAALYGEGGPR